MKQKKGFSLIEIMIVLAIISILAAVSLPAVYSQIVKAKQEGVKKEMENLKIAIVGDAKLINNGVRTDFGYLGDVGSIPDNPADLDKLAKKKSPNWSHPDWSFESFLRVGAGWKGPYITGTFTEDTPWFKVDEWGNEYVYDTTDYTNSKGDLVDAKIQSWGPDEAPNTDDDITVEIFKTDTTGTVFGYLNMTSNKPLSDTSVSIHHPKDGALVSQSKLTDANGYYRFDNIPYGVRSISLGAGVGISYVPNSVNTTGNGQNVLFSVQNVSPAEVILTSLKAEYPAFDFYETVKVDNALIFSRTNPRIEGGEPINFSTTFTLSSGSLVRAPTSVYVDKPTVQVPTIAVASAESTLGVINIELGGFKNKISGAAQASDMRGVPFVITFNDGSAIRFVVPPSGK